jgi:hypothetical protein
MSWKKKLIPDKRKVSGLQKSLKGIIVVSPLLWLIINVAILAMLFLLLPKEMIIGRFAMLFIMALVINGWFWAGLLSSYLFRDASHKFMAPNVTASLGKDDGFITHAPEIRVDGKIIEPQYTIRAISGFAAYGIHTKGRIIVAYPTEYETIFPGAGVNSYAWLRSCSIDQVAENVRIALVREGAAHGIYTSPRDEIWFSRTVFNIGDIAPNRLDIAWDLAVDEKQREINRLKAIVQEKDYQIESYELARSREAYKLRPASDDFRDRYHEPPESMAERSKRLYPDPDDEYENRRRRF